MTAIELASDDDWKGKVLSSKVPVIVDFWAPWCPWCMKMLPIFEEVSKRYEGRLVFAKLNVEEHEQIAESNDIAGIPVLKMFCNGKSAGELTGYMTQERLVLGIEKMLSDTTQKTSQRSTLQKETMIP